MYTRDHYTETLWCTFGGRSKALCNKGQRDTSSEVKEREAGEPLSSAATALPVTLVQPVKHSNSKPSCWPALHPSRLTTHS